MQVNFDVITPFLAKPNDKKLQKRVVLQVFIETMEQSGGTWLRLQPHNHLIHRKIKKLGDDLRRVAATASNTQAKKILLQEGFNESDLIREQATAPDARKENVAILHRWAVFQLRGITATPLATQLEIIAQVGREMINACVLSMSTYLANKPSLIEFGIHRIETSARSTIVTGKVLGHGAEAQIPEVYLFEDRIAGNLALSAIRIDLASLQLRSPTPPIPAKGLTGFEGSTFTPTLKNKEKSLTLPTTDSSISIDSIRFCTVHSMCELLKEASKESEKKEIKEAIDTRINEIHQVREYKANYRKYPSRELEWLQLCQGPGVVTLRQLIKVNGINRPMLEVAGIDFHGEHVHDFFGIMELMTDSDRPFVLTGLRVALEGLHTIHKAGVIHRDIKPENILTFSNGSFKVTDFGLAAGLEGDKRKSTFAGTRTYAAPEYIQYGGTEKWNLVCEKVDIWAFGLMLLESVGAGVENHPIGKIFSGEYYVEEEFFRAMKMLKLDRTSIKAKNIAALLTKPPTRAKLVKEVKNLGVDPLTAVDLVYAGRALAKAHYHPDKLHSGKNRWDQLKIFRIEDSVWNRYVEDMEARKPLKTLDQLIDKCLDAYALDRPSAASLLRSWSNVIQEG